MYRLCTIFGSCHRVVIHGRIELRHYPSVKWKLLNLQRLARQNPEKLAAEAGKLKGIFTL